MQNTKNWYVIYTKARSEKKVAKLVNEIGLESYCPVKQELRQWSDRKKKVEVVLFTSYVFVYCTTKDFDAIYSIPGFVRFVPYLGKPAVVQNFEIENIRIFLEEFSNKDVSLFVNQEVTVTEGPLKGRAGTIVRLSKNKAKLQLRNLGLTLFAEVHKNKIQLK
jgi:transcription antitermination factor NusG